MNILRRGTRTARRILDGLLVSILVVVVLAVILGRIVPLTGRTTLVIGGGSMEPAIPLGAAVAVAGRRTTCHGSRRAASARDAPSSGEPAPRPGRARGLTCDVWRQSSSVLRSSAWCRHSAHRASRSPGSATP